VTGAPGDADDLVAMLARWAAGERRREASAARVRERRLRQQLSEAATLTGVVVDLAERREVVSLLVGSDRVVGRLVAAGADFYVIEDPASGAPSLVAAAAVAAVAAAGGAVASGDRAPVLGLHLADALAELAAEMVPARLRLTGGQSVSGTLVGAGLDVVTLRPAHGPSVHAAMGAVQVCALR
jgi:hypothetical protein